MVSSTIFIRTSCSSLKHVLFVFFFIDKEAVLKVRQKQSFWGGLEDNFIMTTYYLIQVSESDVPCIEKYIVVMIVRYQFQSEMTQNRAWFSNVEVYFVVQYDVLCFLNPKNTWLITLFVSTNDRINPSSRSNYFHLDNCPWDL